MQIAAVIVGVALVVAVLADLINTLVTTQTSSGRWWLSRLVSRALFLVARFVARLLPEHSAIRERVLATLAPVSVLILLVTWSAQQVVGFGLIWWGLGDVAGVDGLLDAIYYSGVVYFTVGFGEVVPEVSITRFGAIIEAFTGVMTSALVIGYLPALYSAYSERERALIAIDDGTEQRITPTNLVFAWAPDADPSQLNERFREWEGWVSSLLETHTTFPMLRFFRSQNRQQNWVTALGLLCDVALHAQLIERCHNRENIWFLRRAIRLFDELTLNADLSSYQTAADVPAGNNEVVVDIYRRLEAHGFTLLPLDVCLIEAQRLRARYGPPMEYLIDEWMTPRGFWGHKVGLPMRLTEHMIDVDE